VKNKNHHRNQQCSPWHNFIALSSDSSMGVNDFKRKDPLNISRSTLSPFDLLLEEHHHQRPRQNQQESIDTSLLGHNAHPTIIPP